MHSIFFFVILDSHVLYYFTFTTCLPLLLPQLYLTKGDRQGGTAMFGLRGCRYSVQVPLLCAFTCFSLFCFPEVFLFWILYSPDSSVVMRLHPLPVSFLLYLMLFFVYILAIEKVQGSPWPAKSFSCILMLDGSSYSI